MIFGSDKSLRPVRLLVRMPRPILGSPVSHEKQSRTEPARQTHARLAGPQLAMRLREKRAAKYVEAMPRLNAGMHQQNAATLQELLDATEFPELTIDQRPLGIVSKCFLEPYEVHGCDLDEHFERHRAIPPFRASPRPRRTRRLHVHRGLRGLIAGHHRRRTSQLNIPICYPTLSQGMREVVNNRVVNEDRSVAGALGYASRQIVQRQTLTSVLTETQDLSDDTQVSRQLLAVAGSATERGGCIIVITTSAIWPRLQRQGMSLTLDPSNENEMQEIIAECLTPYRGGMPIEWHDAEMSESAAILAGVTRVEAENAIATLLAKGSITKADLAELTTVKDRIFSDISGLERVKISTADVSLGGLSGLRAWMDKQRPPLTMDLRERGLRSPRGDASGRCRLPVQRFPPATDNHAAAARAWCESKGGST